MESVLGSVISEPRDFVLLNDAFAVDPLVVDIAPGAVIDDPIVIVHVINGGGGEAVFPRTFVRSGATSTAGVVEIVVDVDAGLLADLPSGTVPPPVDRRAGARSTSWCR